MTRPARKREIEEAVALGGAAFREGKSIHSNPWKAYESTNHDHWRRGWQQAEEGDRLREEYTEKAAYAAHLYRMGWGQLNTDGGELSVDALVEIIEWLSERLDKLEGIA